MTNSAALVFYRILARLVVLAHLAFMIFALFGGLLALRWHWLPWVHVPTAVWGTAVALCGWYCPLTTLENSLRRAAGAEEYTGGFVEHYLLPAVSRRPMTRRGQLALGAAVAVVNVLVYACVWHASRP